MAARHVKELQNTLLALDTETLLDVLQPVLSENTEALQYLTDWAVPNYVYGTAAAILDVRYRGVVKSFSEYHGYGFISSPDITDAFGKDLFVHGHQIKNFQPGDEVDFAILLNKGKPNAFDLMSLSQAPAATKNLKDFHFAKGKVEGKGKAFDGKGKAFDGKGKAFDGKGKEHGMGKGKRMDHLQPVLPPVSEVEVPGLTDRRFQGYIKGFKEGKFGFIICDELEQEYGREIYCGWKHLRGFQVNEEVSFACIMNQEGKIQAVDLQPDAPAFKRRRVDDVAKAPGYA
eukprot:TRINITY_DN10779_c0_g1_i1.p1 TRINITY_DN10779_c0_g1~~TRINITY_DN10779_c0_g1_i1.p1  ORF type:complete len:287 (-),score=57.30 TRINITY_DN10779_c0_g1_i1:165-1025(-)